MSEQERRASLMVLLRVAIDHDRSSRLWLLVICVASRARYLVCVRPCAYLCTQARRPSSTNSSSVRASVQFRPWASTSRPLPTRRSSSTSGYVANQRTTEKEQRRERESERASDSNVSISARDDAPPTLTDSHSPCCSIGRRRSGQDPTAVAPLLCWHAGLDLRDR